MNTNEKDKDKHHPEHGKEHHGDKEHGHGHHDHHHQHGEHGRPVREHRSSSQTFGLNTSGRLLG